MDNESRQVDVNSNKFSVKAEVLSALPDVLEVELTLHHREGDSLYIQVDLRSNLHALQYFVSSDVLDERELPNGIALNEKSDQQPIVNIGRRFPFLLEYPTFWITRDLLNMSFICSQFEIIDIELPYPFSFSFKCLRTRIRHFMNPPQWQWISHAYCIHNSLRCV
jgi:hypothetical protein